MKGKTGRRGTKRILYFELVQKRVLNRICRAEYCLHHPGTMPRIPGFYLLNLRSSHSHRQSRVPFFIFVPKPRCVAAVCLFLHRGFVFRPDDACQKSVSWFSDWIPRLQQFVYILDLEKCRHMSSCMQTRLRYSRERASQSLPTIIRK